MTVEAQKDDYVILRENKKNILAKVTFRSNSGFKGRISNKDCLKKETAEYVEFGPGDIIANLGAEPMYGTVFGVKVEPYFAQTVIGPFDIYYQRRITVEERTLFEKHFTRYYKRAKAEGRLFGKPCLVRVLPNKSSMIGQYAHQKNAEKPDELRYMPPEFSRKELDYVIEHEGAHGEWFTRMSAEWRAKWVKAYARNAALSKVTTEQINGLREEAVKLGNIAQFGRELDEDGKAALKECLRVIKRTHTLTSRDLDDLIAGGDDLAEYWPVNSFKLQHRQVFVSEYANKSPAEMHADAMAFHRTGAKDLPNSIVKLVEKTEAYMKAEGGGKDEGDEEAA